ncbi:sphinganine-1-phosphate aldolase [Saccharomycopsis crataegensis]|uniref:sphinganine-1-phosphate aldolase n=1 Tax=Saccharomycopsis crataegensis TaxID=43959 RepID=A0AAV5QN70_9ASCO|nr:sphinganine-1-phosphate aldolase [Saccharomycopsis crataegensis]
MAAEFRNIDIRTMGMSELRDYSEYMTTLVFMMVGYEVMELIEYIKTESKVNILKNIIFYHLVLKYSVKILRHIYGYGVIKSVKQLYTMIAKWIFNIILSLPPAKKQVNKEVQKALDSIEDTLVIRDPNFRYFNELPQHGLSNDEIFDEFEKYSGMKHNDWENGKVSGAVYHGGKELIYLQAKAFEKYCVSNQLHPDAFPGLRKMESEVVSMCLNLFNAPETGCGTSSSGGTESLLLACLSAKMFGKKQKGITEPEIIAPETVHAGIDKACYYFGIKLHKVPLNKYFQGDMRYFKRLINSNTILLVGSAPNFPHGIIDDIEALSKLALKYKIPLHVDCCLGSFIVSYMERAGLAGKSFPKFDFRLPGVTSISCDTHKYGFAPKGSSIIMYRNEELRSSQYYVSTDWIGGLYGSPTLSGSRPGALMAGCWTTMVKLGDDGYKQTCRDIVGGAQYFKQKIMDNIPELQVIGDPILSVVAFESNEVNVYDLGDLLSKKGWHLSALQNPPALHVAFTVLSADKIDELINELQVGIKQLKENGSTAAKGDTAQVYGTAGSVSTGAVVNRIIEGFIDTLYKV